MKIFWIIITLTVMSIGLVGTLLPFIPGIPLIYGCFLFYGFVTGWESYGLGAVVGWGIVTVFTIILEFYAGSIGAQRYGASKLGMWLSIVGGIVGIVVAGFIGIIVGPFVGAVVGVMIMGKSHLEALKSGWGTVVGFLAGSLFKIAIAVAMIGSFIWWVVFLS